MVARRAIAHARWAALLLLLLSSSAAIAEGVPLKASLDQLESVLPETAPAFAELKTSQVDELAQSIERGCGELSESQIVPGRSPVPACHELLDAKRRVDAELDRLLTLRGEFAAITPAATREQAARAYLRCVSRLIDLTGRLRYVQFDAFDAAAAVAMSNRNWQRELLTVASEARCVAAANAWSVALRPAAPDAPATLPASEVLRLFASAADPSLLPPLVDYVQTPSLPPAQLLRAAEAIRALGLPQHPRPQEGKDAYQPLMTATELHQRVAAIPQEKLTDEEQRRRTELLDWLAVRMERGVTELGYAMGNVEVRPGDWLLMRNPSPYNHFSSLSPGLFTHVGVVTDEVGPDGKRRLVVVDLPERGDRMPATNFDTFILRTLHYVVLRHPDADVASRMADVARTLIDTPTEFDLNFDTSRVTDLRGKIAPGVKVKTYCAGLLLVCAQETTADRATFFPIPETVAGGMTAKNLATLGLAIRDDFISPTGPMFSPTMTLVARREPLYEPGREIREAIYDHFAAALAEKPLTKAPTLEQSLRIRLAEMAKQNKLLGEALARTNNVSAELDLVAAAKAAAVVESLDEIADGAAEEYVNARDAIRAGNLRELRAERVSRETIQSIEDYRRRHQQLWRQWDGAALTPRELREALVTYYVAAGKGQIDEHFFGQAPAK